MDVPWVAILIAATNLSNLAVLGATTYYRIKTTAAQFEDMRLHLAKQDTHLAKQDKIAVQIASRVDSVGRHADVRYIEQRIAADIVDTPEQARLRNKISYEAAAIQSSNVGDGIGH